MAKATQLTAETIGEHIGYAACEAMKDLTDKRVFIKSPMSWGNGERIFPVYDVEYDPDMDVILLIVEPA